MERILIVLLLGFGSHGLAQGGPGGQAGSPVLASAERVEIRGVVDRVDLSPGRGAPLLFVRTDRGIARVQLGPMRFLIERDFNPKAGTPVRANGLLLGEEIVARTVELPEQKKTIELRSEDGVPLWRMGRYGKKGR